MGTRGGLVVSLTVLGFGFESWLQAGVCMLSLSPPTLQEHARMAHRTQAPKQHAAFCSYVDVAEK